MAVSFTAEYLYQGARFIRNNPVSHLDPDSIQCPEFILGAGRSIYALGTLVVSPVGALYHISAAAYRALAKCWTADAEQVKALDTHMWQHLYAAGYDALGTGLILLIVAWVMCVVFAFVFQAAELLAPPLYGLGHAYLNDSLNLILPYFFALYPGATFRLFLSDEKPEGINYSQADEYIAHYMFSPILNRSDEPLTPEHIVKVRELVASLARLTADEQREYLIRAQAEFARIAAQPAPDAAQPAAM